MPTPTDTWRCSKQISRGVYACRIRIDHVRYCLLRALRKLLKFRWTLYYWTSWTWFALRCPVTLLESLVGPTTAVTSLFIVWLQESKWYTAFKRLISDLLMCIQNNIIVYKVAWYSHCLSNQSIWHDHSHVIPSNKNGAWTAFFFKLYVMYNCLILLDIRLFW